MPDQPNSQDQGGRPPILDETKRRKILALLANAALTPDPSPKGRGEF